jgi:hypothetical protein
MGTDRGQAYTLEGVISAILIASALVLGINAISIQPFTGDGPEQGTTIQTQVGDALEIAQDKNALKEAVTCLRPGETTPDASVVGTDPAVTELGSVLANTLEETTSPSEYTVYVDYHETNDQNGLSQIVIGNSQVPGSGSVTVTRQVVLYDSDPVYEFDSTTQECVETGETLGEYDEDDIYLTNRDSSSEIYAVVQIRVIAW